MITYTSLQAAVAAIGSSVKSIVVAGSETLSANLTIPATLQVTFAKGAIITLGNYDLTINGLFSAESSQCFSYTGTGVVTFATGSIKEVYPEWWGNNTTPGTTDMTAEVQAAVNSITTGIVKFGSEIYKIVTTISINNSRVKLVGTGPQSTKLYFAPASAIPMLDYITTDASILYQNGLENLTCYNNAYAGSVAIRLTDTSEFYLHRVAIYPWTGVGSIGLQLRGRELMVFDNIEISATLPISIEDNPNSIIDIDQCIFRDSYLIAGTDQPCVFVDDGVNITNLNFEGRNAWVPSNTHAFYWNDTTTTLVSLNLNFKNIRIEQETGATSYMFYISHNSTMQNVLFENIYGGLTQKGYYLRNVMMPTFINCWYVSNTANEAINVDNTVLCMSLINCFWQASTTATLTGQRVIFGSTFYPNTAPMAYTSFYDSTANAYVARAMQGLAVHADNVAAKAAGKVDGDLYMTAAGVVMVVYT